MDFLHLIKEVVINNFNFFSLFITAILTIMGWVIIRKTERIKIIESQLSEKKYKAYADAVSMFYAILEDSKSGKSIDYQKNLKVMLSVKRDILMYGSDKVFNLFNDWLVSSTNGDDPTKMMNNLLKFILEIRRDMRNGDTKLKTDDILLNLTQSREEVKKLKLFPSH